MSSWAHAVSADGRVVVGESKSANGLEAFQWTAKAGMVGLGDLPGGVWSSYALGVSADGSVIVGCSSSSSGTQAFRWTEATGMVPLGSLPSAKPYSIANAVSADGQVIVGESRSWLSGTDREAFRWTIAEGMIGLGDLPGGDYNSVARAVSADGSVIVGDSGSAEATYGVAEAFCWTQATGIIALGDFPDGAYNSIAYGVSADGSIVVGRGYSGAFDEWTHEAFRWSAQSGLVRLGFAPGDDWSIANAVSADGNSIVGDNGNHAIIWDPRHGMRRLKDALIDDYGLDLAGWELTSAAGITPDGKTIVGSGTNPAGQSEAWIANLEPLSLQINRGSDYVVLSWASAASGFVLEFTSSLPASSTWSIVADPIHVLGDQYVVTNRISRGPNFFRLRKL